MRKLFKLKTWLTLEDAATHLSAALSEPVTPADILQLSLDGTLTLSVNIVGQVYAKPGRAVRKELAPKVPGIAVKGVPPYEVTLGQCLNDQEVIVFEDSVRWVGGIFDLPMIGGEHISVERLFHQKTGGPLVAMTNIDGVFLFDAEEDCYYQLYEDYLPPPKADDNRPTWERRGDVQWIPLGKLPNDVAFVVRSAVLAEFVEGLAQESHPVDERVPSQRERSTYLNIVAALLELTLTPREGRTSEARVIREIVENYGEKPGISERTLTQKFAEAKRSLMGM